MILLNAPMVVSSMLSGTSLQSVSTLELANMALESSTTRDPEQRAGFLSRGPTSTARITVHGLIQSPAMFQ